MKVGDIVSEALEFGVDWEEAEKYDQTQKGVIFKMSSGMFHILWFDTQKSSARTDYWARSKSVRVVSESR